ncbi:MAG: DUF2513 domain-containing protein [Methyloligellaceae bacterium]
MMKRDLDTVRELLFYLEEKPGHRPIRAEQIEIEGRTHNELKYQLILMYQAGFLDAEVQRSKTNPDRIFEAIPFGLSWDGHEFLETVRDDDVWRKTKTGAKQLGTFSYDVLRDLAKSIVKKKLSDLTAGEFGV